MFGSIGGNLQFGNIDTKKTAMINILASFGRMIVNITSEIWRYLGEGGRGQ